MNEGFRFDIEIRKGAGAYICGEETAIFNSIEGFRGEPRNKPPFPVQAGVFGKPTLINNVETLHNVLEILRIGGPAYARIGTEGSTGPRLFCLSGNVVKPGVYEVPFGATLGDVLAMAGGVPPGRTLQAILLGGAAGGFVRPDELHIPLSFEGVRAASTTLGSGVVMAFDDTIDMKDILRRIAAFFRDESCGQCVPCRVGTVRQEEALHRITVKQTRGGLKDELALLEEIGLCMKDASICGLGQTAYSAIESAIKRLGLFSEDPAPMSALVQLTPPRRPVELTIDGETVTVPEGTTLYDACRARDKAIPTLCYLETLHPVNACRVCVVEVEGSRVLVPSCSRKVEAGMKVSTHSERVRHSRKMVLELLASSVDLTTTPGVDDWLWSMAASRSGTVRRRRRRPPACATATRRAITRPPMRVSPRRLASRSRWTTSCTCATTESAFSATSASRPAGRTFRTPTR